MYELIKSARTRKQLEEIVPGMVIIIDGTHIRTEQPADSEERNARFDPKKMPTANTAIMINKKKIIIGISDTVPGRAHNPLLCDLEKRVGKNYLFCTLQGMDTKCAGVCLLTHFFIYHKCVRESKI